MTITHTGLRGPEDQWTETVEGATPNSVSVSTNAKGQAQIDIKLYFATPNDLQDLAPRFVRAIVDDLRRALADAGIPLAGQDAKRD